MRLLLATAAIAAALPFGTANAGCTDDEICAVECVKYVVAHLDPKDPRPVCPR